MEAENNTVVEFEDNKKFNTPVFLVWIAFAISLAFAGFLWISKAGLNSVIAEKTEEKESLTNQVGSEQYADIEDEAKAVKDAIDTLTLISQEKVKTTETLKEIYDNLTTDVKITSFSMGADNSIVLDGATASYRQAADFMVALKSSERLSEVSLSTISLSPDSEATANQKVIFSVSGKIDRTNVSK